jgi:RNA polymerase sigma-70 factor (ECF subfamily)
MMIRKTAGAEKLRQKVSDETDAYELQPDLRVPEEEYMVQEAVGQLPGEQKLCLSLLYLEDKSYRDISETTGYSLNQVKSYVQNGKRNLRNYMQNRYDFY